MLAEPEAKGFDLSAWIVPGVLVAVAALGVGFMARRWRRTTPAQTADGPDLDPDDARRLDQELATFDR